MEVGPEPSTKEKDPDLLMGTPLSSESLDNKEWPDYLMTQQTPNIVWFPSKHSTEHKVPLMLQYDEEQRRREILHYPLRALAIDCEEASTMVSTRRLCLFKSISSTTDALGCNRVDAEQQPTLHSILSPAIEAKTVAKPRPVRIAHRDRRGSQQS